MDILVTIQCTGMLIFVIHFLWVNPQALQRKGVLFALLFYTTFWWATYILSWWLNHKEERHPVGLKER